MASVENSTVRKTPIIIVDDDRSLLSIMEATLISAGFPAPVLVSDSREVMEVIRNGSFAVALIDLVMPHLGGMELLQQIKAEFPLMECIIVTAVDEVSSAVRAVQYGAYDYLLKPLDSEKLPLVLNNALEKYSLKREVALLQKQQRFDDLRNPQAFAPMVAADAAMARIFHQAEAAAETDYSLIISGESGTGKEVLARIIHSLSPRAGGPFVAVNMAAFSQNLFEDSFFGHEKGAFTGASADKAGLLEAAEGGTLFLDEIGELAYGLQAKFLRVIQEREFMRLGSSRVKTFNVRFIAATNRSLDEAIKKKQFREDLFYRLNMFHLRIPPLRERRDDILPLAEHFLRRHAVQNSKDIRSLSADFLDALERYAFPGNVRELESIIAKAVLAADGTELTLDTARDFSGPLLPTASRPSASHHRTLAQLEKDHIRAVLASTGGNRTHAARILAISVRTLQRKIRSYSLS